MAKKTKDGLIVQAGRRFGDMLSSIGSDFERYKTRKYRESQGSKAINPNRRGLSEKEYNTLIDTAKNSARGLNDSEKKSIQSGSKQTASSKTVSNANKPAASKRKTVSKMEVATSGIKEVKPKASTATEAKIKKLGSTSESSENKPQLSDKQRRQQNRAANLAIRKGISLDEASALKEKRRTARKQYLRNFASQLARGEQAAPITGFGEGDNNPNTNTSLAGASAEVKAQQEQVNQDKKDIFANVNTDIVPNQSLGDYSNFGENLMGQVEVPDLTPLKYMQKQYRKKRGL